MRARKLLLLFVQFCFYLLVNCEDDTEWIDPFKLESEQTYLVVPYTASIDAMAFYKRTINLILSSTVKESSDLNTYKGRLFIDIPIEDYMFLKKFGSTEMEEPLILQKVDEILTKVLTKSAMGEISDMFIYWSDYIYYMVFNRTAGVYLIAFSILIVVYKLLKASYTPYQVVIYLSLLGYLIDFAFTWKRMMQELEINKYVDTLKYNNLPADCKLPKMSGWQLFISFISGANNCREYHRTILYDVFWDVGPLDIIAHQSRIFLSIASNIGIALSKLVGGLMSGIPFPLNIILLPVLLLFVLFLVWSILTYFTDTHIELNLCHLVYMKFTTNKAIKNKPKQREKKIRKEIEEIDTPPREKIKDIKKEKTEKRKDVEENIQKDEQNTTPDEEVIEEVPTP